MLAKGRSPNYMLREEHAFGPWNDEKKLPQGTFVRPIHIDYVPKHCLESPAAKASYIKNRDIFCYTSYGIIPIPKDKIQEIP